MIINCSDPKDLKKYNEYLSLSNKSFLLFTLKNYKLIFIPMKLVQDHHLNKPSQIKKNNNQNLSAHLKIMHGHT